MQTKKTKGQVPPKQGATEKMAKLFMMIVERYAKLELKKGDDEFTIKKNESAVLGFARYHRKDFIKILKLGGYYENKDFDRMVEALIGQWGNYGDTKLIAINSAMNSATAFLENVDLLHLNKSCFSIGAYVWLTRE